jgi:succinate dehydrogenase/fumarate reductase-like Fe-S protein
VVHVVGEEGSELRGERVKVVGGDVGCAGCVEDCSVKGGSLVDYVGCAALVLFDVVM